MSDDDDKYKQKLHLLASRCESIQRENDGIARQVVKTRRNLSKARRLRMRLLQKLDEIGDPWRQGQVKGISLKSQNQTSLQSPTSSRTQNLSTVSSASSTSTSSSTKKSLLTSPDLDMNCSSNLSSIPGLGSDTLSMSEAAAALVSTLTNMPMPMLPMPVSPTPSPFADHDLLPSESLANSL